MSERWASIAVVLSLACIFFAVNYAGPTFKLHQSRTALREPQIIPRRPPNRHLLGEGGFAEALAAANATRETCESGSKRMYVAWKKAFACVSLDKIKAKDDATAVSAAAAAAVDPSPRLSTSALPPPKASKNSKDKGKGKGKKKAEDKFAHLPDDISAPGLPQKATPTKESPVNGHISVENRLRDALVRFTPYNKEKVCVSRHAGGMAGTLIKEVQYGSHNAHKDAEASISHEILKDASCCSQCSKEPRCEFWVRDTTGTSCWLMRDFAGLVTKDNRRSSFNAKWAAKQRSAMKLPPPPAPGTPGIGEIAPDRMIGVGPVVRPPIPVVGGSVAPPIVRSKGGGGGATQHKPHGSAGVVGAVIAAMKPSATTKREKRVKDLSYTESGHRIGI